MINPDDFITIDDLPLAVVSTQDDGLWSDDNLDKIVEVNNARYAAEEYSCITQGHQAPGQTDLENVCHGMIDKLSVGEWQGKKSINARFRLYKGDHHVVLDKDKEPVVAEVDVQELMKMLPRRSIEIYTTSLVVPAVALLGASKPGFDLGVKYRESEQTEEQVFAKAKILKDDIYKEEMGELMSDDNSAILEANPELVEAICQKLLESAELSWVRDQMQAQAPAEAPVEEAPVEEAKEETTEEAKDEPKEEETPAEEAKDEPKEETKEEAAAEEDDKDKEIKKLHKANAELMERFKHSEREKVLMFKVAQEGLAIDVNKQLKLTMSMNDDEFNEYSTELSKIAKKAPIRKKFDVEAVDTSSSDDLSLDRAVEIKEYALANGIDFKTAYNKLGK